MIIVCKETSCLKRNLWDAASWIKLMWSVAEKGLRSCRRCLMNSGSGAEVWSCVPAQCPQGRAGAARTATPLQAAPLQFVFPESPVQRSSSGLGLVCLQPNNCLFSLQVV